MFAANTGLPLSATAVSGGISRCGFGIPTIRVLLIGLVDLLIAWQERAIQRHRLAGLDERGLKDVALSRADIAPEVAKPFWRA